MSKAYQLINFFAFLGSFLCLEFIKLFFFKSLMGLAILYSNRQLLSCNL